ncbi:MAG: alpha-2-macroglobulin [Bacteroides sp.]|nr:alpha-2-macroglobulin [Bacteroides sp.]
MIKTVNLYAQKEPEKNYEALWQSVEIALMDNTPRTAARTTQKIIRKAEKERHVGQLLKATLCYHKFREHLEPELFYTHLKELEEWAAREERPVEKAILHSLLLDEYTDFMANNLWELRKRTPIQTDERPDDLREWDLQMFIAKIDEHCGASLQADDLLMKTPSHGYIPFVEQEEGSAYYGHDLYHLLVSQAINSYHRLEPVEDEKSFKERIAGLYEERITRYSNRPGMEDAVILSSIPYIDWKFMEEEEEAQADHPYLKELDNLIARYGHRPMCAEVYISKIKYLKENEQPALALRLCGEAIRRYPSFKRINLLKNLRSSILHPSLEVRVCNFAYPGTTVEMEVKYKNLKGFTLQLYAIDEACFPVTHDVSDEAYLKKHGRLLSKTHYPLVPQSRIGVVDENLPYIPNDTTLHFQVPEETGIFLLRLQPDRVKGESKNVFLASTRFKVLKLLTGKRQEFTILDALTGHPVEGASLFFYDKHQKPEKVGMSDAGGRIVVSLDKDYTSYAVRKGQDMAMPLQRDYLVWSRGVSEEKPTERLTLLTDRSLYRPGQTVFLKGVAYRQKGDEAQVLEQASYVLVMQDAGNKEISRQTVTTNDFGSFTAEFVLPSSCLNGRFRIYVLENRSSRVDFRVEAYKRPTFEVVFHPLTTAYKLGEQVTLRGHVKAYNGMSVQHVPVACRVSESAYRYSQATSLLTDTVMTDEQGNFALPLSLQSQQEDWRTWFTVEAVVTSETGETRTSEMTVQAGERAFSMTDNMASHYCKEEIPEFTLCVKNANGEQPDGVTVTYRLYHIENDGKNATDHPQEELVMEGTFTPNLPTKFHDWCALPSGEYVVRFSACDTLGHDEAELSEEGHRFLLFSKADQHLSTFRPFLCHVENDSFDVGRPATIFYGVSHEDTYVMWHLFAGGERVENRVLRLNNTLTRLEIPYREEYGDEALLLLVFVKEGEEHEAVIRMTRPQLQQTLDMKWEAFRDRLQPGQQEEWRLVVKDMQNRPAVAELLATMYDASLDAIYRTHQQLKLYTWRPRFVPDKHWSRQEKQYFRVFFPLKKLKEFYWLYDHFHSPWSGLNAIFEIADYDLTASPMRAAKGTFPMASRTVSAQAAITENGMEEEESGEAVAESVGQLRTNFSETAFFYPQLRTDEQGGVVFSFTMPQSLTQWNFRAYAHTRQMETGRLDATVTTSKEFMLTPQLPRFFRTGDKVQLSAMIANLSDRPIQGTAHLTLFDPLTEKRILTRKQQFALEAGATMAVSFTPDITVDGKHDLLGVRMVADGDTFSDGEQHLLPVLDNRMWLTETLPISLREAGKYTYTLDTLFNRNNRQATQRRLTVEFTGNPAWEALLSLPDLTAPTNDNAISWATAFCANALAGHVANSQPRIKQMVEAWKLLAAAEKKSVFAAPLQQNEELKEMLLEESPWLLDAVTDADRRTAVINLFDSNRLTDRTYSALNKLKQLQRSDGSWSWYKGMDGSYSVTTYIMALLLRYHQLTACSLPAEALDMERKGMNWLHRKAVEDYQQILRAEEKEQKEYIPSGLILDYLYLVALDGGKVPDECSKAYDFFLNRVEKVLPTASIQEIATCAVVLLKAGRIGQAEKFLNSLREHLVQEDGQGAHFAFLDTPYRWGMMPIPIHVSAMEALAMAGGEENDRLLEEMKVWLLMQKQTTSWDSPVATADAVYALLCRGEEWLAHEGDVDIKLGRRVLKTTASEALPGVNYVKAAFTEGDAALKVSRMTVEKHDEGLSWGAVYAQYLTPITEVHSGGNGLRVEKQLYVERLDERGVRSLQPLSVAAPVRVGDKVVCRLVLNVERAIDFVCLKDRRAACLDPVGQLSGYRWSRGIGYYVEPEDASTNFFFDALGAGVYVLEYSSRVSLKGTYESGVATLQSAYAPAYAGHSTDGTLVVE